MSNLSNDNTYKLFEAVLHWVLKWNNLTGIVSNYSLRFIFIYLLMGDNTTQFHFILVFFFQQMRIWPLLLIPLKIGKLPQKDLNWFRSSNFLYTISCKHMALSFAQTFCPPDLAIFIVNNHLIVYGQLKTSLYWLV